MRCKAALKCEHCGELTKTELPFTTTFICVHIHHGLHVYNVSLMDDTTLSGLLTHVSAQLKDDIKAEVVTLVYLKGTTMDLPVADNLDKVIRGAVLVKINCTEPFCGGPSYGMVYTKRPTISPWALGSCTKCSKEMTHIPEHRWRPGDEYYESFASVQRHGHMDVSFMVTGRDEELTLGASVSLGDIVTWKCRSVLTVYFQDRRHIYLSAFHCRTPRDRLSKHVITWPLPTIDSGPTFDALLGALPEEDAFLLFLMSNPFGHTFLSYTKAARDVDVETLRGFISRLDDPTREQLHMFVHRALSEHKTDMEWSNAAIRLFYLTNGAAPDPFTTDFLFREYRRVARAVGEGGTPAVLLTDAKLCEIPGVRLIIFATPMPGMSVCVARWALDGVVGTIREEMVTMDEAYADLTCGARVLHGTHAIFRTDIYDEMSEETYTEVMTRFGRFVDFDAPFPKWCCVYVNENMTAATRCPRFITGWEMPEISEHDFRKWCRMLNARPHPHQVGSDLDAFFSAPSTPYEWHERCDFALSKFLWILEVEVRYDACEHTARYILAVFSPHDQRPCLLRIH